MESVGDPVDTTRLPGGRRLGLVVFAVLACHEDAELPSFTIETQRTRIALDERYELDPPCAGDLAHIVLDAVGAAQELEHRNGVLAQDLDEELVLERQHRSR